MIGGWSAWTAARSMLPTSRPMSSRSGGREAVAATAPTRRSALWRWSRRHPCFVRQPDGRLPDRRDHARQACSSTCKGMLCLADRQFFGFALWQEALGTGADLVWRIKRNMRLAVDRRWPDGSYVPHLCERAGLAAQDQRRAPAGGRLPAGRRGRRRADLSPGHQHSRSRPGAGCKSWPPSTTSAGKSRQRSTSSNPWARVGLG